MLALSSVFKALILSAALVSWTVATSRTITVLASRSCAQWVEDKRSAALEGTTGSAWFTVALNRRWLLGYVSGLNAAYPSDKNLLAAVNAAIVEEWIDKYCAQNPKKDLIDGAERLMAELAKIAG